MKALGTTLHIIGSLSTLKGPDFQFLYFVKAKLAEK